MKGNKNDHRDAEAIVEAASRPTMRYVSPKTVEQQDIQSVFRVREGLVTTKTKMMNQVRGLLSEYECVIPLGFEALKRELPKLFDRKINNELSDLMKNLIETQYELVMTLENKIDACDATLKNIVKHDERCKRLMDIEGVGVITAAAIIALAGNGAGFKNGRHFAAFIGLVPKQYSSGNKQRLLGISKRGDEYVRRMLIHGARSAILASKAKKDKRSLWIQGIVEKRGMNVAAVALANKNARIAMSLLLSEESYKKSA